MKQGGLTREEENAVREFVARLRDRFPQEVEAVKIYGSKARGTAHPESDVDLLIIVKDRTKAIDEAVIDLVCDMIDEFGVFLETVTLASTDYHSAIEQQAPFVLNVERDAISL